MPIQYSCMYELYMESSYVYRDSKGQCRGNSTYWKPKAAPSTGKKKNQSTISFLVPGFQQMLQELLQELHYTALSHGECLVLVSRQSVCC